MNILILTSSNRNFPLDIHQEITKAGQSAFRFSNLADFLSSPLRKKPYLALVEIGNPEDVNRGILAYEWACGEEVSNRFLILMASKYLQLGEKALRLAGTESAVLPMASKNLLFKIELQLKLLLSEKPKAVSNNLVFRADLPVLEKTRILKIKGPNPQDGSWNKDPKESPSGKIRWRWVRTDYKEAKEKDRVVPAWTLESKTAPVYVPEEKAWRVDDSTANLLSHFGEEEIFSLEKLLENERAVKSLEKNREEKTNSNLKSIEKGEIPLDAGKKPAIKPENIEEKTKARERSSLQPKDSNSKVNSSVETTERLNNKPKVETLESAEANKQIATESTALNKKTKKDFLTEEEVEKRKFDYESMDPLEPGWKKKSSSSLDKVSTPGEDHRDRILENRQAGAQLGAVSESEKKAKYSIEEESSAMREKKKIETLLEEALSPQSAPLTEEDAKVRESKRTFDIQEKNSRETLAAQEVVEGKAPRLAETLEANSKLKPREKSTEDESPTVEKEASENLSQSKEKKLVNIELPQPTKETNSTKDSKEASEIPESFQSVAKSYIREKEVSKKIVMDPQNNIDPAGKIEVEIPADLQKLEVEKRISQYPPKLESEQTFSKDPEPKARESDFLKARHFEIYTLEQLNDQNSTWHPVDQFRIYLAANHRYYGIKDVRAIFPLWIYTGELAPEFLEKEKAWKFYDRAPQRFLQQDPLPVPVARFIQKLAGISDAQPTPAQKIAETPSSVSEEIFPTETSNPTSKQKNPHAVVMPGDSSENEKPGLFGRIKRAFGFGK